MASLRTQIYLTKEQRDRLDEIVRREDKSLAQVIREAIDAFVGSGKPDFDEEKWIADTFGSIPDFDIPHRENWSRRDERIWGAKPPGRH
jgi:hypothetical protein